MTRHANPIGPLRRSGFVATVTANLDIVILFCLMMADVRVLKSSPCRNNRRRDHRPTGRQRQGSSLFGVGSYGRPRITPPRLARSSSRLRHGRDRSFLVRLSAVSSSRPTKSQGAERSFGQAWPKATAKRRGAGLTEASTAPPSGRSGDQACTHTKQRRTNNNLQREIDALKAQSGR